jgi:hypothetical protein
MWVVLTLFGGVHCRLDCQFIIPSVVVSATCHSNWSLALFVRKEKHLHPGISRISTVISLPNLLVHQFTKFESGELIRHPSSDI